MICDYGYGVLKDDAYAYMWWSIAAAKEGNNAKESLAKGMTPEDVSRAQDLAREFVKKNYREC